MNTLLRSLVVWLLLLAVPFQGMAAAAMVACAPQHGTQAPVAAAVVRHALTDAQVPPCHEAASRSAAPEPEPASLHGKTAKCAACSACGIGSAALPTHLPQLASHAPAAAASPAAAGHLPSVHLAQPERPPRPALA